MSAKREWTEQPAGATGMSPRTPGPTKPGQPAHLQRGTHSSDHLLGLLCGRGERSLAHGQHPYLFCLSERVDFFSVQIQGGKRCSPKQNSKEVPTFHHPYLGEGMSARDQRAALSGAVTGDCLQQEGKVAKVGKKKKKRPQVSGWECTRACRPLLGRYGVARAER